MKNEPKLNPRQIRYLASIGVISPSDSRGGRGKTRLLTDGEQRIIDLVAAIRDKGMSIKNIHPAALASIAANSNTPFLYLNDPSGYNFDTNRLFCVYWDGTNWFVATTVIGISQLMKKAIQEKAILYGVNNEMIKELFDGSNTNP